MLHVTHLRAHGVDGRRPHRRPRRARRRRAPRARRVDPVRPPRRGRRPRLAALDRPRARRPGRDRRDLPDAAAVEHGHLRRPQAAAGDRRRAGRRRTATSPSARADGLRIAGWYRPSRNGAAVLLVHGGGGDRDGRGPPRADARPPRLRRPAVRRARPRRERGQPERLRLEVDEGRRRRDARSSSAGPTSTPAASARSASRPAPTSCSRRPRRAATSTRSSPTAPPPDRSRTGTACRATTGADAVLPLAVRRPARVHGRRAGPAARRPRPAHHGADAADLGRAPRGVRLQRDATRASPAAGPSTGTSPDTQHTHGLRDHPRAYERRVVGFLDRALR